VLDQARAEAGRRRNQADDYCDKRLAQLETVLERTMKVVGAGRARLRGNGSAPGGGAGGAAQCEGTGPAGSGTSAVGASAEGGASGASAVFDQDRV
jgi:hypothetical protein